MDENNDFFEILGKKWKLILSIFIGIVLILGSFFIVSPGEVGVIVRLGKVNRIVDGGLHFKIPLIESVRKIDTRISREDTKSEAASKDLQSIHATIALNYGIKKSYANKIYTNFLNRENLEERIVAPAVQETMKSVTAKFTAEELITNRAIVSDHIKKDLSHRLISYGIDIDAVSIVDFDFSPEFNKAVESKNVAVQKSLKAERDLTRIKIESEQKISIAKAEAESLRLQKTEISENMIRLRAIQKWDGKLPSVVGSGASMFMGVDFMKKQ